MIKITGVHPAAEAWPMFDETDLRRLADDIKANGQRHPIIVTSSGLILDGRNRYAACQIAGVEPWIEVLDPDDPVAFVLSENAHRRHLPATQLAAAYALTLGRENRVKGKWRRGVAAEITGNVKNLNVPLSLAGTVLDHLPDLLPRVAAGDLALDIAHQQALEARRIAAQRDGLPADLRALVDSGQITIPQALRRAALPESYAQRVADGAISVDEAEQLFRQDERDHREAIERDINRMRNFLDGIYTAATLPDNPDRDAILDGLGDHMRDRFLIIEKEMDLTWPTGL